jgi:hypothetical protein
MMFSFPRLDVMLRSFVANCIGSISAAGLIVTHQAASSTWLKRVSRRKIRLSDVQLYVFCQEYQQQHQRRGQAGAFEIYFHCEEGEPHP